MFDRASRRAALALCGIAFLTAQSPAPVATPGAPAKPLRHLEFAFSADYEGVGQSHYSGGGGTNPIGGTASSSFSGGRVGTISVDVLSIAPDGGLLVEISEWIRYQPRPRQTYRCTVYGNTTVVCPQTVSPSDAEWALLQFLGRQFVDAAPWDADRHWQFKDSPPGSDQVADFTMSDSGDGKTVVVKEVKKIVVHNGSSETITDRTDITYDRSMEVPVAVRVDRVANGRAGTEQSTFNFTLTADSFAKRP